MLESEALDCYDCHLNSLKILHFLPRIDHNFILFPWWKIYSLNDNIMITSSLKSAEIDTFFYCLVALSECCRSFRWRQKKRLLCRRTTMLFIFHSHCLLNAVPRCDMCWCSYDIRLHSIKSLTSPPPLPHQGYSCWRDDVSFLSSQWVSEEWGQSVSHLSHMFYQQSLVTPWNWALNDTAAHRAASFFHRLWNTVVRSGMTTSLHYSQSFTGCRCPSASSTSCVY